MGFLLRKCTDFEREFVFPWKLTLDEKYKRQEENPTK